ncbi:hypothetical protein [Acinetobacter larvae]|uniref:Replication protein n=1 Tax=Acinetobacter larvae TaxID=1789224 RepID=A0A1B2LZE1_9GAMM|nr:hypothetical protein [Acinetobacter larvae]AOA58305.1 hypothetical protein BFG52_07985 [Acinetobacter larvae]
MSHYATLASLGRAIAYFPQLGIYLGNPLAGIFLSQLIYWHDKTENELGVYKTSEEWTEETGLSYRQQATARTLLKKLGLITETEKRLEHKLYFKLNINKFDLWFENCTNFKRIGEQQKCNSRDADSETPERRKRNSGEYESAVRGDTDAQFVIHKITTENTSNISLLANEQNSTESDSRFAIDLTTANTRLKMRGLQEITQAELSELLDAMYLEYGHRGEMVKNQVLGKLVQWVDRKQNTPLITGTRKSQTSRSTGALNRNVNDAWANQPRYQGPVEHTEIPEDFI